MPAADFLPQLHLQINNLWDEIATRGYWGMLGKYISTIYTICVCVKWLFTENCPKSVQKTVKIKGWSHMMDFHCGLPLIIAFFSLYLRPQLWHWRDGMNSAHIVLNSLLGKSGNCLSDPSRAAKDHPDPPELFYVSVLWSRCLLENCLETNA